MNTATASSSTADPIPGNNSGSASTTVSPSADLSISKTGPGSVTAGTNVVFTTTVTNNGSSDATSVVVSDPTPSGLSFVSNSGNCTTAFPCALGTVPAGATRTITSTYAVPSSYTTPNPIVNTASVSSATSDPAAGNDSSNASVPVVTSADLSISKTGPASVTAGTNVVYTVTVTNGGSSDAASVSVSDPTPAGLVFVSNSGDCTTPFPCALGSVAAGATRTITSTYSVPGGYTTPNPIVNTASVSSATSDPAGANDSSSASTPVVVEADLSITKTGPASATPGANVVYTVVVTNSGASSASSVVVSDPTPPGLVFVSNSGNCVTSYPCSLGTIPAGATRTITSTYSVPASYTSPDPIQNSATVSSATTDPDPGNNSDTESTPVAASADLSVSKSAPASVTPGSNLVFTVSVTNNGVSDAANVVVADPTPPGLVFVSNSGDCTTSWPCAFASLPAGATRTVTSTFSVPSGYTTPDPIVNTATASSDTSDPTAGNDSSTSSTSVTPSADLAIAKTGPSSVTPGNSVSYSIVVSNAGASDAANVVVTDPTPAGLVFVSNSGDCTTAFPCSLGTVEAGSLRTITATYSVPAGYTTPDPIVNTASVSTTTSDPAAANDSSSASTSVTPSADLAITKTGPASVTAGSNLVYTVVVTNNGASDASGVVVSDATPAGLSFVSNSGHCVTAWPCSLGSIPAGATRTITSTFAVPASYTSPDPIENTASVASATSDPNTANDSATSSTPLVTSADLSMSKTGPASVQAGTDLVYTITVTNGGLSDAQDVVVSDATPAGLSFVSNSGDCTTAFPCSIPSIAAGASATITTTFAVPAAYTTPNPIVNTASVTSATSDPAAGNNSDTESTPVSVSADLSITKTGPGGVTPGTNIVYTVIVQNNGPASATSVSVADPTPAGLTFVSNTGDCTTAYPCALGTLAPGEARQIRTTFSVPPGYTTPNPILNTATVSSATSDPAAGNNSSTSSTNVTNVIAELGITKTGPATVIPGNSISYTVTITNNGPSNTSGATVVDPTPSGLVFVSNSGDCTTPYPCALGLFVAGTTKTITSVYSVPSDYTAPNPIENFSTVSSGDADPVPGNDTSTVLTTVTPRADLSITKTAPASIIAGQDLVYTITVTNGGASDATGVSVADPTPAGLVFVSNTGDCTTGFPCSLGTVPAGATRTITTTFAVPSSYTAPANVSNTATVSATTVDPAAGNNSSTTSTNVLVRADMEVTKTGPAQVTAGSNLVYTVTVTNNGASDAQNVSVADPTPAGLVFVSNTGDCTTAYPCSLGTVTAGGTRTITTTYSVPPAYTTPDPVVNTATVSTTTTDPVAGNNSSSSSTPVNIAADLTIVKTGPASITPGTNLVYTITVTNNGSSTATGVVVNNPTPQGLAFVSNTGACTTSFPCSLGSIPPGTTLTITVTYAMPSDYLNPDPILNTATVTATTNDPNPDDNSSATSTPIAVSADLSVNKSGPVSVTPGNDVVYTVTVTNLGASDAQAVSVADPTPSGLVFVSNTGDCASAYPCDLGTLVAGATRTITSTFSVPASYTTPDPIVNTATASSPSADPSNVNNSDTVSTAVTASADLTISKTGPAQAVPGQQISYTVTVTNEGASDAQNVSVADPTPAGLVFVSNSGDCLTAYPCSFGTLAPGAVRTITSTWSVPAAYTTPDPIVNTATVSSTTSDPDGADNSDSTSTPVSASANLAIAKDGPITTIPGDTASYTITLTNAGPSTAANVVVTDTLDADTTYTSSSIPCSGGPAGPLSCAVGSIAPGATTSFTVTVQIDSGADTSGTLAGGPCDGSEDLCNTATVSSTTTDPDPADNSVSEATDLVPAILLSLAKTDSPDPVLTGGTLTYVLTYSNATSQTFPNAVLTEVYDPRTTFVSSNPSPTSGNDVWALGDLAPGAVGQIEITLAVNAGLPDGTVLANNAVLSADLMNDVSQYEETVVSMAAANRASLQLIKSMSPERVPSGGLVTYTLTLSNGGPATAYSVVLADSLPAGLSYRNAIPAPTGVSGQDLSWNVGNVAAGTTQTFVVYAESSAQLAAGTMIDNVATADGVPGPGTVDSAGLHAEGSVAGTATGPGTDCTLVMKKRHVGIAEPGSEIVYRCLWCDPCSDAQGVEVSDLLPAGLELISISAKDPSTYTNGEVSFDVGVLPAGRAGVAYMTVRIAPEVPPGTNITNSITITDAALRSQTGISEFTVGEPSGADAEGFLKVTGAKRAYSGARLNYQIRHGGLGGGGELAVTLGDGIDYRSATPEPASVSGRVLTWTNLPDLGSVKIRGTARIADPNVFGAIASVEATGRTAEGEIYQQGFDTALLVDNGLAGGGSTRALSATLTGARYVTPGLVTTLKLRYRSLADEGAALLTLPPGLDFVSAIPSPTSIEGNTLTWLLPPGSGSVSLRAVVDAGAPPGSSLVVGTSILSDAGGSVGAEFQATVR